MLNSFSKSIRHYIRGGQLFSHQLNMGTQVFILTVVLSIVGAVVFVGSSLYRNYDPYVTKIYKIKMKTELLSSLNRGDKMVELPFRSTRALKISADEFLKSKYVAAELDKIHTWFSLEQSLGMFIGIGLVILIIVLLFYLKGREHMKEKIISGNTVKKAKDIAKTLIKSGKASDCVIDGLPLVKNSETQHIGMIGTTGTGKSVLIKKLITYARSKNHPGLIYDKTGQLTELFYEPERGDLLLNPFDKRAPMWDIWADCISPADFDTMAANIIIPSKNDPFWSNGARLIFSALAREYKKSTSKPITSEFLRILYSDLSKVELLKGTEAAHIVAGKSEKTLASFLNVLIISTKSLRYMSTTGEKLSLRKWVENGRGFLFLTSRQDIHESLKPLFSCWINTVINTLMCQEPSADRRCWFFIDELPSLQAIPSICDMLAEGRKFGACGALGFQSIAQIDHLYGSAMSQAMAALLNTQFFFRQGNDTMSEWASRNIGEATYLESHEGVSYGANTVRDGVSINKQEKVRRLATAQTISSLPDLSCYVRLMGNQPVAEHILKLEHYDSKCAPYEIKEIENESSQIILNTKEVTESNDESNQEIVQVEEKVDSTYVDSERKYE